MALDRNALGLQILGYVNSLTDADKKDRTAVFRAMGRAIVDYLHANAEIHGVQTGVAVVSAPGAVV